MTLNDDFTYNGTNPIAPTYDADGNITNADENNYHTFTNDDRYNYAPVNYLLTPQERWSAFVQGKYELSDDVRLSSEVLFNHRESSQLLAPAPLFIGPWAGGAQSLDPTVVSAENIYNPFGQDIFAPDEDGDAATVGFIGRRMLEGGGRVFRQTKDTWRFGMALDGDFEFLSQDWGWSLGYSFAENAGTDYAEGKYVTTRIRHALSAECNADPSCVPLNLFGGEGAITKEQLDYISYNEHNTNGDTLINYSANLSGALVELPAGPLGVAVGWEYRREKGFDSPDYIVTSGQTSGNARKATEGSFSEYAYYLELNVPVLADMPFAESLEFDFAIRQTELENSVGLKNDNTSGKVAMAYKPISDVLVRASWSQGFRAPTINNLFGGLSTTFPTVTDPCNDGGGSLPGCSGVPDGYSQPNSQVQGQVGSNSNLTPETSESISAGIVYSPSSLEGFDVSVDYWDIQIDDRITRAGHQQVLDTCAGVAGETNHPVAEFCDQILQRAPGGTPVLFANPSLNLGSLNTSGFDLTMNYGFETSVGDFRVSWDNTYTDNYSVTNNEGVETKFAGEIGLPRLKSNLTLSWGMDDLSATWKTRLITDQRDDCRSAYADFDLCNASETDADGDVTYFRDLGDYYVHDLQVGYYFTELNSRFTLGVNNVFDEEPPLAPNQTNSFDGTQYDGTGRYFYGRLTVNF
ncbi:TonB-dependent receptor [Parashewanella spongiae]|uniref:TonB-dependent receptor domain-containing protein n=1 Tax=Parashewanella spongiae TaxID=342950 RepID=UPI002010AAE5|nr:TonB-dependent receptor [Parashewanella spongiae]MCL1078976.1 TonB-dependent receptor [Parashewanella spongiae]